MPADYASIRETNVLDYGRKIKTFGPKLIARLYNDRTHFIFELLQNAEDAIAKRQDNGPNEVEFDLKADGLLVSHYGEPFDEADIRGICGIDESTKPEDDLTTIGRFGIGFKSVFAFTDRPEIHCGEDHFCIDSFVLPEPVPSIETQPGQTVFWFPFRFDDAHAFEEIAECLETLRTDTLLFLRSVDKIIWSAAGRSSGTYSRRCLSSQEGMRHVMLCNAVGDEESDSSEWLVFSSPVFHEGKEAGQVEIAFRLVQVEAALRIVNVPNAELAAFFHTEVKTGLGFVLQGPFRTTPSRETIPIKDEWNHQLVELAGSLLVDALVRLKEMGLLTVEVLAGVAVASEEIDQVFQPITDQVAEALRSMALLPTNGARWVRSGNGVIGREGLRNLLSSQQLSELLPDRVRAEWLHDELALDRFAKFRGYLRQVHNVKVLEPRDILPAMKERFLKSQPDEWIRRLYKFLQERQSLLKLPSLAHHPWIRLEDGRHVPAHDGSQICAFLPSKTGPTGFPTVKATLCKGSDCLKLLKSLGVDEPDPVDDVLRNVIPIYSKVKEDRSLAKYKGHLRAIETALGLARKDQRDKLLDALRGVKFIVARDTSGKRSWQLASDCYIATERLTALFEGVPGILFVDDSVPGLQGEKTRDVVLVPCGASRILQLIDINESLSETEKLRLRQESGDSHRSYDLRGTDRSLRGLNNLLQVVGALPYDIALSRWTLLWEALSELVDRRGEIVTKAVYRWKYHIPKEWTYDPYYIRRLKETNWIPSPDASFRKPTECIFEKVEPPLTKNAVLQSALGFRPPIVEMLANEIGIESAILDALIRRGIRTEAQLIELLGKEDEPQTNSNFELDPSESADAPSVHSGFYGGRSPSSGIPDRDPVSPNGRVRSDRGMATEGRKQGGNPHAGRRPFISYIATNPVEEEEGDISDSATYEERMRTEAIAIEHILKLEPDLHTAKQGNAGFDLYTDDSAGNPNRWIEVKALNGTLDHHPVGMSSKQFLTAQLRKTDYWLYIVEKTMSKQPRILRIQDPAGNARTFTFDPGWREIANIVEINLETGEVVTV